MVINSLDAKDVNFNFFIHWWKFHLIFFFFWVYLLFFFSLKSLWFLEELGSLAGCEGYVECPWDLELNEHQVLIECGHGRYCYLGDRVLPRVYHVLMLGLDRSEKSSSLGLHSTTRYGDAPTRAGPVGGTSRLVGALGVIRAELWVLSLSRWRKVFVYLWQCGRNLGQILRDYQR